MRKLLILLLILPLVTSCMKRGGVRAFAQGPGQSGNTTMRLFVGTPTGSCSARELAKNVQTGDLWDCENGAWRLVTASSITAPPGPVVITPGQTLPNGLQGNPYNQAITVTGGIPPYTTSILSGVLPAGITVSPTGQGAQFTGTPTAFGSFLFTLQACDTASSCAFLSLTLLIAQGTNLPPPVVITGGQSLPAASQGMPYSASITATGGNPPYTVTLTGSFPPGLAIAPTANGAAISGTPNNSGTFAFGVQICDSDSIPNCASASFSITVAAQAVSIPAQTCPRAFAGVAGYSCTISAQGGQTPYSWSQTLGSLPAGLTFSTVNNNAVISGTPSTAGTANFTLRVTAADSTSASSLESITVNATSACGFPNYGCARSDFAAVSMSSLGVVPPNGLGCQSLPCITTHPCSANSASAPANLQNCGNLYGINQSITDPTYNNVQITRVSDYRDMTSGCNAEAGIGGSANWNLFTMDSNYFAFGCTEGNVRIKWFNPSTGQLNTSQNPMGYVVTSPGGPIWQTSNSQLRASYTQPGVFFNVAYPQILQYTISNGVMNAATTTLADLSLGIPCWNTTVATCGDWPGATAPVQPGTNIIPLQNNASTKHSFQLINSTSCTTGASYPNFLPATVYPLSMTPPPFTGTARGRDALQFWLQDGTCRWADMWIPLPGGNIAWQAGFGGDTTDTRFAVIMSNHLGQDSAGACFAIGYDANKNQYSHLNTCTGQVYNTTCGGGGTGYNCAGGSFTRTYVGNVYDANPFPSNRSNRFVSHGPTLFNSGQWIQLSSNNCALVSMTGDWTTYCPMGVAAPAGGGANPQWGSKPNPLYWQIGTSKMLSGFDWLGTGTPGHDNPGFNINGIDNNVVYLQYGANPGMSGPNRMGGKSMTNIIQSGTPEYRYFDQALAACTPPGPAPSTLIAPSPAAGQKTACFTPQLSNTGAPNGKDATAFNMDGHMSWVDNHGSDSVPMCMGTYAAFGLPGAANWPPLWPWEGEVICIFTNITKAGDSQAPQGYNESPPVREANYYNTETSIYFGSQFNVGQFSSDGAWWVISSDWYCTLGTQSGGTANVCGLPYQLNHNYAVAGELMGPIQYYQGVPGRIYKVITPGTTDGTIQPASFWCNTPSTATIANPGCQVTEGTAVFAYVGQSNAMENMFIVKLQ